MRFLGRSILGLMLFALTLGLLTYAGQIVYTALDARINKTVRAPERKERVFAVSVQRAKAQDITPILQAFGQVQSQRTLEIRAKTGGTVVALSDQFKNGGRVAKGDFLARIDPANAQSALDRATTQLQDAQAEVREATRALDIARDELTAMRDQAELRQRAYDRQVDLETRGVGTAAAVETAELAAAQARQNVLTQRRALAQAEARLDQSATRLSRSKIAQAETTRNLQDTEITAGFTGTLSNVSLVQGRFVAANEQLAQLVDDQMQEVSFRVSTQQYARLLGANGLVQELPVQIALDAFGLDLTTTGHITRESADVGQGQTGRQIFAHLDPAPGFKPGDFVTVSIEEPMLANAVLLPATAYGSDGQVLALDDQDRLRAVPAKLLRRQGNDVILAGDGLDQQRVVTERSPLIGAGIKVRPLNMGAAPQPEDLVELDDTRRAELIAFVESNTDMTDAVKTRLLGQLSDKMVPAKMVRRLEQRMGG